MAAAGFVARDYYLQDPKLLEFVLSKPVDRVKYTNLTLQRGNFEEIMSLAVEGGVLKGTATFDDYCDPSFVRDDTMIEPWPWKAGGPAAAATPPVAAAASTAAAAAAGTATAAEAK
jgi:NitT/TauT family transport system substrate-binding protein